MLRAALAGALVIAAATGCGSQRRAVANVRPADSSLTQPIAIRIDGLKPREQVKLSVSARDARGVQFRSSATFRASRSGVVDTAHAAPEQRGSYFGVWPMGLVTAMTAAPANTFYWHDTQPFDFTLTAAADLRTVAKTTFRRRLSRVRLKETKLTMRSDGLVGTFVRPVGAIRRAALLEFGGSEGGPGDSFLAAAFASDGIPTLTLGYFHAPGLPPDLHDIPLEYFERALRWLERQPAADPRRVTVVGISRGSEAALLVGVHYPKLIAGVIAASPSNVVICGIHVLGVGGCFGPSWTLDGQPLPYSVISTTQPTAKSVIPVEKIRAPLMLICGEADDIWPSCRSSHAIVARIHARHGRSRVSLYAYPGAGHYVGALLPYEPGLLAYDEPTEQARERVWPHVVAFIRGDE